MTALTDSGCRSSIRQNPASKGVLYKSLVAAEWIQMERLSAEARRAVAKEFAEWQHQPWEAGRVALVKGIQEVMGWATPLTPVWLVKKYGEPSCLYALETTRATAFRNPRGRLSFFLQALGTLAGALRRGHTAPACLALLRRAHKAGKLPVPAFKAVYAMVVKVIADRQELQRRVLKAVQDFPHELKKKGARLESLRLMSAEYKMPPEQILAEAAFSPRLAAP